MSKETHNVVKNAAKTPINPRKKDPKVVKPVRESPRVIRKAQETAVALIKDSLSETVEAQSRLTARLNKGEVTPRVIYEACKNFESAVGGRESLATALAHCPPNSIAFSIVKNLVADPDFLRYNADSPEIVAYSLDLLCNRHKLPFNGLVQAFKDAKTAEIAVQSLMKAATAAPKIVDQVLEDAQNRIIPCFKCDGQGRSPIIESGEYRLDDNGEPKTRICGHCDGRGTALAKHDTTNRKLALQIAGVTTEKPLVQQTFNDNRQSVAFDFTPGNGGFERMVSAIDRVMARPTDEILEAEVVNAEQEEG